MRVERGEIDSFRDLSYVQRIFIYRFGRNDATCALWRFLSILWRLTRYEEMWKVFNISMSSLVSVCTAILGSVAFFHQSSSFSHFFMNINFNRKVHTEIGLSLDCNYYNLEAWSMISSKLFPLRKFSFRLCQTRVVYEKR